ncbi:hypothetical protein F4861DRAFT_290777 [Xylaria intraflava]|nr:hypothetical protein F4861DRAFT_290777 [Xylaria intraflava]
MEAPASIDYKGIGEGLHIRRGRRSSPGSSTINLSDGEQVVSLPPTQVEDHPHPAAKPATNAELVIEPSSVSPNRIQWSRLFDTINKQPHFNPLDRYYCDAQAHEQVAMGQAPDRRSPSRLDALAGPLGAVVGLPKGSSSLISASSDSTLTSSSVEDSRMTPSLELDGLLRMADLPEWQNLPDEEQLRHLRKITKLKRRLKTEGSPRTAKPVRIRRRSKMSDMSNETNRGSSPC